VLTSVVKQDEISRRRLGKFDPDDYQAAIVSTEKGSTYHDVTLFVENLREMDPPPAVHLIQDSLCGTAVSWFMGDLSQDQRAGIRTSLEAWIEALLHRFKLPYSEAVGRLQTTRLRGKQSLAQYASIISRLCRNVTPNPPSQFIITSILFGLPPAIQRILTHVNPACWSLNDFMDELLRLQTFVNTMDEEHGNRPAGAYNHTTGYSNQVNGYWNNGPSNDRRAFTVQTGKQLAWANPKHNGRDNRGRNSAFNANPEEEIVYHNDPEQNQIWAYVAGVLDRNGRKDF